MCSVCLFSPSLVWLVLFFETCLILFWTFLLYVVLLHENGCAHVLIMFALSRDKGDCVLL